MGMLERWAINGDNKLKDAKEKINNHYYQMIRGHIEAFINKDSDYERMGYFIMKVLNDPKTVYDILTELTTNQKRLKRHHTE